MTPIDARTRLVALLGDPVHHSLSPLIHNTAFRDQGLNLVYLAFPTAAGALGEAVAGLRALGFAGANVTLPHKKAVRDHVDVLSPQADAVGAVNTLVVAEAGGETIVRGDNTDVVGFLEPLHAYVGRLQEAEMVVLGAGGAARAVVYALLSTFRPSRLTLVARRPAHAAALADDLAAYGPGEALRVAGFDEAGPAVRSARLVVNATPVGMAPEADASPWPGGDLGEGQLAYDLVYNPVETRFLREAAAAGAEAIDGLGMLVGQAAASYVQWTQQEMPTSTVRSALRMHLGRKK